jgi:hypothetical protein
VVFELCRVVDSWRLAEGNNLKSCTELIAHQLSFSLIDA